MRSTPLVPPLLAAATDSAGEPVLRCTRVQIRQELRGCGIAPTAGLDGGVERPRIWRRKEAETRTCVRKVTGMGHFPVRPRPERPQSALFGRAAATGRGPEADWRPAGVY